MIVEQVYRINDIHHVVFQFMDGSMFDLAIVDGNEFGFAIERITPEDALMKVLSTPLPD